MKRFFLPLVLCFMLLGFQYADLRAQTYPFVDGFESYNNFSTLGTQGGYMSDMSVYSTHGMGNSWKGLIAQMTNFNLKDSTVSPLIGPLTSASELSFYYRVMVTGGLYPFFSAPMLTGDSLLVFVGSQTLNTYQRVYAVANTNHVQDTAFRKIKISLPQLAGQSGNVKIVVKHTANSNDFFVDIDSLSVRDSVAGPAPLAINKQKTNATCYGVCNGTATVTTTGGLGNYTYSWSNGLGSGSSKTNLCAGTFRFTVSDGSSNLVDSVTITQPSQISFSITADSLQFCPSDSVRVCASDGFSNYQWNASSANTNCIYARNAGNYFVTVTDNQNCTASKQISLSVFNTPSISISVNGDTLAVFNGNSFQWYLDDSPIPGATSQVYIATVSGSYSIEITDGNGCHARSVAVPVVINGITEENSTGFRVSPNILSPTESFLVQVDDEFLGGDLRILTVSGQLVHHEWINSKMFKVDARLQKGLYWISIISDQGQVTKRLIQL